MAHAGPVWIVQHRLSSRRRKQNGLSAPWRTIPTLLSGTMERFRLARRRSVSRKTDEAAQNFSSSEFARAKSLLTATGALHDRPLRPPPFPPVQRRRSPRGRAPAPQRLRGRSPDDRHRLRRSARRLRLEPGPCGRRCKALKDAAERQGRRGGERPRDGRRVEDHGIHDQPRRRQADPADLLRLLQPLRARRGQGEPGRAVPSRGAAVEADRPQERRLLLRLPRPGALRRRRRGRPGVENRQARLRGRQADRHRAAQHQLVPDRRPHHQSRTPPCR